jgi:endoglucanase
MTGAWLGRWAFPSEGRIEEWNQLAGHKADIIHTFVDTSTDMNNWKQTMDYVKSQGAINLLTLQTNGYSTVDINNGKLDTYMNNVAASMKSWQNGSEIWVRLFHEGNGNWFDWSIGDSSVNTNTTQKQAFQRIVKIFRAKGATNVKFVYNVNCNNNGAGASYMGAYPGDDYVDYLSIDGYNWGNTQSWSTWQSFRSIFDPAYKALTSGSSRPVIIAEFASTESGGSKAAWITDMKNQIQSGAYPKLIAYVWFNEDKETDWRIQSSSASLAAFKK